MLKASKIALLNSSSLVHLNHSVIAWSQEEVHFYAEFFLILFHFNNE